MEWHEIHTAPYPQQYPSCEIEISYAEGDIRCVYPGPNAEMPEVCKDKLRKEGLGELVYP